MHYRKIQVTIFTYLLFLTAAIYILLVWQPQLFNYLLNHTFHHDTIHSNNIDLHTLSFDEQIYYYNRGYLSSSSSSSFNKTSIKYTSNNNIIYMNNNNNPRIHSSKRQSIDFDTNQYRCQNTTSMITCNNYTRLFKDKILSLLSATYLDESLQQKWTNKTNRYNVQLNGNNRDNYIKKTSKQILCELMIHAELKTLKKSDFITDSNQTDSIIRAYLPNRNLYEKRHYNSCVMVSSSGSLLHSNLGNFIDSHDFILRFNHAPTNGYENDVGQRTSLRILNSQVVTKPEYKFLESSLYKNITILIWDPSNYSITSLTEWINKPDFNFLPNFIQFKKIRKKSSRIFIINPLSIWKIWNVLQQNFPNLLRRNPPSSGFLGLYLLLSTCNTVDIVEYIPSVRLTDRCHYYDTENNPTCTFGVWHPLAAEKLLTYHLNIGSDYDVFQNGYVRINGFRKLKEC